ncbi:MAG: aminodeoxychorismate lyase [Sinimarinibacterium sp.]|jgi:4-amino-4-deoxychorismate lyase
MNDRVLHDGAPCDDGFAQSRALQYGDGVFRTMLWSGGRIADWDLQMDKLAADCAVLSLDCPLPALLRDEIARIAGADSEAAVKVIVARRPGGRGYRQATSASERWVYAFPLAARIADVYRSGARLDFSDVVLSEQPLLAGVKHLNRLDQVLASRAWPDGIDERLMRDREAHIVCGTRTNLFCVVGRQLLTPPLNRCGVAGIMRRKILECGPALGLSVAEAKLTDTVLLGADEVFVCNSLIGLWPVRRLAGQSWAAPGVHSKALMRVLRHPRISLQ